MEKQWMEKHIRLFQRQMNNYQLKDVKTFETCEKFFKHDLNVIKACSQLTVVGKENIEDKPFVKVIDKSH